MCVLFEFRHFFFFTLGTCLRISKFVKIFAKKSDRTRCLAVSILEYNINWNIRSRQSERKHFGFLKEEQNSEVIHR